MSHIYANLVERIRNEMLDLGQVISRIDQSWAKLQQTSDVSFAYVDSVALNLHGFYSGLETLFVQISRQVDRHLSEGSNWHRDLLLQMVQDLPSIRPAVISLETFAYLDQLRRFRHLVRNVYTITLSTEKMSDLVAFLPDLWSQVRAELLAFADYLEALDQSLP